MHPISKVTRIAALPSKIGTTGTKFALCVSSGYRTSAVVCKQNPQIRHTDEYGTFDKPFPYRFSIR